MKILIAEDHKILLDSLSMLLASVEGIEVLGKASNGKQILNLLETEDIDLVISDLHMPQMSGIELTLHIRQKYPTVRVLLLTVADQPEYIKEALRAGADGYVLKSAEKSELELALKTLERGQNYYSPEVLMLLAKEPNATFNPNYDKPQSISITNRELEVLRLIAMEFSGTEIAEKLYISPTTVETHRKHLMQKLGIKSTIGLVKYAMQHQLI